MIAILKRVLVFLIPFSLAFWFIHDHFESAISLSTQNGLAGFYSVDGIIFGLIVAFVVQREWEIWTNLSESVWTEISAMQELWKWCACCVEVSLCKKAHEHLKSYLRLIISEWNMGGKKRRNEKISKEVDRELDGLRNMLADMALSMGSMGGLLQTAFVNLIQARNQRLIFSNEHMPGILKRIVTLADVLLILLSLFISVNNIYLDYIFTASISLLAFTLILVVDDLDNPFRPGTWHLTTEDYQTLLAEFSA
jgi:hypothetical protein